jgi:hypothetical protein
MSNESVKVKHSKRIHQKETHISKQTKILKQYGVPVKEEHRLAKRHALNCGSPKCVLCGNPRKLWHELTIQEKRHYQDLEVARARHSNGTVVDEIEVYLNVRNGE